MAFWSGEKLAESGEHLIDPFSEQWIDCNAYTLHMGEQVYRTSDQSDQSNEWETKVFLTTRQPFKIPPGQFAFLQTKETVNVPTGTMAFISIKATYKFQGLINVSGFHVDPGYHDKLVFSVFNAGSSPVHLEQGMPLFLIWYADLDRESAFNKKGKPGHGEITNELIKGMSKEIMSLQSVTRQMNELQNTFNTIRPVIDHLQFIYRSIILAVALLIVVGFVGFSWDFGKTMWESIFPISSTIESDKSEEPEGKEVK